jgi:hypothetical protein
MEEIIMISIAWDIASKTLLPIAKISPHVHIRN